MYHQCLPEGGERGDREVSGVCEGKEGRKEGGMEGRGMGREEGRGMGREEGKYYQCDYGTKGMGVACLGGGEGLIIWQLTSSKGPIWWEGGGGGRGRREEGGVGGREG